MRKSLSAVLGSVIAFGLALPATAQTSIDTYDGGAAIQVGWVGDRSRGYDVDAYAGGPDRHVFSTGQTFQVAAGSPRLDVFSFFVSALFSHENPGLSVFRAFVLEWDAVAQHAVGPVLFESGSTSGTEHNAFIPATDWERRSFTTAGLVLDPTRTYLALLSGIADISAAPMGLYARNAVGGSSSNPYTGGYAVASESREVSPANSNGSTLTDYSWPSFTFYTPMPTYDAAFEAHFSSLAVVPPTTVTPEPVSMVLLGTGLMGLGAVRRRRRR